MRSELISERHLARRAVIYIRQSTAPNSSPTKKVCVFSTICSRALELGWREQDVEVIDADLGQSAAAAAHREGFKGLIARVILGQIGIVLSYEVTRLSRNCTDWYPLLDLCSFKNCPDRRWRWCLRPLVRQWPLALGAQRHHLRLDS